MTPSTLDNNAFRPSASPFPVRHHHHFIHERLRLNGATTSTLPWPMPLTTMMTTPAMTSPMTDSAL